MGEAFIVRKGGGAGGVTFGTYSELELISETSRFNAQPGVRILYIKSDNDFIYGMASNAATQGVNKFHKGNLAFIGKTNGYGATARRFEIDNDFIYVGGAGNATANRDIKKYHKGNLAFVDNTAQVGAEIQGVVVDNDFIYAGGEGFNFANPKIRKYHKGNLVFVGNTADTFSAISELKIDNDFIYGGSGPIQKFHKGNLALVGNTIQYGNDFGGGALRDFDIDDDFIYAVGSSNVIRGFHKGNLALISTTGFNDNSVSDTYGFAIFAVSVDNDFVYVFGLGNDTDGRDVKKYHKSNLAFVANTEARSYFNSSAFEQPLFADNDFVYCIPALNRIAKFSKENNTTDPSFPVIEDNSRRFHLRGEGL